MAPWATVDLNRAHGLSQIMHCLSEIFCYPQQLLILILLTKVKKKGLIVWFDILN